ncbi:hypothetical protein BCU68_03550 [Vibrio sp. 10N.286.49.B3]|uniref:hypothetical protein n=1 Tax=Vibrio sp. 10N.286.49.B3 TaxID=1880855 RepID=UPI000C860DC0|nr:hypothetical protein [Vibrio sp. 10N.286.49.B3]PMH44585.1 hypothetical protein BCU68_03550 [Vibrio sp. 10N.286.49.B3]
MKLIKVILMSLLIFSPLANAARVIPVVNQPLHSEVSVQQAQAIFSEAVARRGWNIKAGEDKDSLIADLWVRNHYIAVDIKLHQSSYDINYRDSENMKYKPNGTIHKKYNGWVRNFNNDIQKKLRTIK